MKVKRSRIIVIVIIIVALVAMVFKLKSNRARFKSDIAISQRQVESVPVTVENIVKGSISKNVIATGVLEASEVLNVVSETQGKIIKVLKEKGDNVSAGDLIVKVDDEVIAANVLTAEANYEQYERDIERLTRLASENAVTKRDLEQAQIGMKKARADLTTARKALSNTSIKAPIAGYINNDFVTVGQFLGGGSQVCEIVNNSTLKINIKVTEQEVFEIQKGKKVNVRLTAFPDRAFSGRITAIAEKADAGMKFNVEITLVNDVKGHLKSGLYAEVELPVESADKLVITKTSIIGSMEKPEVFVVTNNKAEKRKITIGMSNDTQVEVLNGLSEGEKLIISGQLNIKNGDNVKVVNQ
ncbi:MAG TPA: efflux RND transporter periplasmic adaptor subunit [Bacteroidales bacterium]|nr:efflux RND transporter periplasmic adaptor subunit [Bacteroidales bacterium]